MKNRIAVLVVGIFFLTNICIGFQSELQAKQTGVLWSCTVLINESGGKLDDIVFGEASDARDGPPADAYDVVKPPSPLVPYLRAWCDDNLPAPYNLLWEDYRYYPDTFKTWNVSIQWVPSDYYTPTTVTITWDITETSASPYSSMHLYTHSGVFLKNMLIDDRYTFNCPANVPQRFQIICMRTNNQPGQPSVPSGETTGYHGTSYIYSTSSIDPDGDDLYYQFDWGTSIMSSWVGPYQSGEMVQMSYRWDAPGSYPVRTHAKDIYGKQSDWSLALFVEMMNRAPFEPTTPVPSDKAIDVQTDPTLRWTGGDPDGDHVTFDVYFGTVTPPPKMVENQSSPFFLPGFLTYKTTYYWRIISWDSFGGGTSSPIWSFTTRTTGPSGPGDTNQTNLPPVADASLSDQAGFVGTKLLFNGNQSYDSDGYITRWFWDFGDGTNGSGEITTHTYQSLGVYSVVLTVTDEKGATGNDSIIVEIGIANHPPTTPVITGTRIGERDILYTYTVSSTDPDNDFLQYTISWGDGTFDRSEFLPNGTVYFFSHSWSAAGKFHVTITATDNMTVSEIAPFDVFIDVFFVRSLGFLYDTNNDELYDSFYSNATGMITSAQRLENGSYLLDTDSDGKWNYLFDPTTGSLTSVGTGVTTIENQWVFIGIIAVAVCCIAGIVYLYKKRYF